MAKPLKTRIHGWLAERVPWVQYPGVTAASDNARLDGSRWPFRWRYAMPFWRRVDMVLISLFGLVVSGAILFFLLAVAYSIIFG